MNKSDATSMCDPKNYHGCPGNFGQQAEFGSFLELKGLRAASFVTAQKMMMKMALKKFFG